MNTQNRKTYNSTPNILLRLGKTEKLNQEFADNSLTFSCAANWIDYALKHKNYSIGDLLEGVFARIPYPISNQYNDLLVGKNNKPLNDAVLISKVDNKDYCYLRYRPTISMPAICFYGLDYDSYYFDTKKEFIIDFDKYARDMGCGINDSSIIIIKDAKKFQNEIIESVKTAIIMKGGNLTNAGFTQKYSNDNCLICKSIDYHKYNYNETFFDNTCNAKALFCKQRHYDRQSEFRIVINNLRFKQLYFDKDYNYKQNLFTVYLPHLKEYSEIISLKEYAGVLFSPYNEQCFYLNKLKRL